MKIIVKAKPGAKEERVERITQPSFGFAGIDEQNIYKVSVKEPPIKGLANEAIVRALARHLNISSSQIRLTHGVKFKQKIFEIL